MPPSLKVSLHRQFEACPPAPGFHHYGEIILLDHIYRPYTVGESSVWSEIEDLCLDQDNPDFSANTWQCLSYLQAPPGRLEWRVGLVESALKSPELAIREAAMAACSQWMDKEFLPVLEKHRDSVDWVEEFRLGTVEDLRLAEEHRERREAT